jgi:uncharacterized protein (DUF433 family)
LTRITYNGTDGLAEKLVLPMTSRQLLEVDPLRGFGAPRFIQGGAPLRSVVGRIRAGEPAGDVADDYGLPLDDVIEVLRASA